MKGMLPGRRPFSYRTLGSRRRQSLLHFPGFPSGRGGRPGRIRRVLLIEILPSLAIIPEKIHQLLGGIDPLIVVVAKRDDGGVLIQHSDKDGTVAMPPAIVIDQLLAIGDHQHTPTQPIVTLARLFEAIARIGAVQDSLGEKLTAAQGLIPFIQIAYGAEDILVPI